MAALGAQHLLRRPQCITAPGRVHDGEVREIDSSGGERGRIRQMRRGKPDHALAGPRLRGHGGQDEL